MSPKTMLAAFSLVLVGCVLLLESVLVVGEDEQVLLTRFGQPVGDVITEPGRYLRVPMVDTAHRFAKGPLPYHGEGFQVPAPEGSTVRLEIAARWRVTDARVFYQGFQDESRARARLDGVFRQALEEVAAAWDPAELIEILEAVPGRGAEPTLADARNQRFSEEIVARAQLQVAEWGIKILDVETLGNRP